MYPCKQCKQNNWEKPVFNLGLIEMTCHICKNLIQFEATKKTKSKYNNNPNEHDTCHKCKKGKLYKKEVRAENPQYSYTLRCPSCKRMFLSKRYLIGRTSPKKPISTPNPISHTNKPKRDIFKEYRDKVDRTTYQIGSGLH